ncbi:hypothetical protein JCM10296v2_003154 [Rhodotorula toruloides]
MPSTDSHAPSNPLPSPEPSSPVSQCTGPRPFVDSPAFQAFYSREAAQLRKEKPEIGEKKVVKAVEERWEQRGKGRGEKRNRRSRKKDPEGDGAKTELFTWPTAPKRTSTSQTNDSTKSCSSSTLPNLPPTPPIKQPVSPLTSLIAPFALLVGLSLLSPTDDTPLPDVKPSNNAEHNPPKKTRRRRRAGRNLSKEQKKVKYDERRYKAYLKRGEKRLKKAAAAAKA